jgi:uncharacterized protein YaaR (DUF327 family)
MAEAIQALQDEQRRAAPPRAVDRDRTYETKILAKLKELDQQLTEIEEQLHDMETQKLNTFSIVEDIDKRLREAVSRSPRRSSTNAGCSWTTYRAHCRRW